MYIICWEPWKVVIWIITASVKPLKVFWKKNKKNWSNHLQPLWEITFFLQTKPFRRVYFEVRCRIVIKKNRSLAKLLPKDFNYNVILFFWDFLNNSTGWLLKKTPVVKFVTVESKWFLISFFIETEAATRGVLQRKGVL